LLWSTVERLLELGDEQRCDRRDAVYERDVRVSCPERVCRPGAILLADRARTGGRYPRSFYAQTELCL